MADKRRLFFVKTNPAAVLARIQNTLEPAASNERDDSDGIVDISSIQFLGGEGSATGIEDVIIIEESSFVKRHVDYDQEELDPALQAILSQAKASTVSPIGRPVILSIEARIDHPDRSSSKFKIDTDTSTTVSQLLGKVAKICHVRDGKLMLALPPPLHDVPVFGSASLGSLGALRDGANETTLIVFTKSTYIAFCELQDKPTDAPTTGANSIEDGGKDLIELKVKISKDQIDSIKLYPDDSILTRVRQRYPNRAVLVDGDRIAEAATPATLGLESGDQIDLSCPYLV